MRVISSRLIRHTAIGYPKRITCHRGGRLARQLSEHTGSGAVKSKNIRAQSGKSVTANVILGRGGGALPKGFCISHRRTVTYGATLSPLSLPSLAQLSVWRIIIQRPQSTSVPLNGCALSMPHCQGASAT